jgi:hypothetical protein
MRSRTKQPDPTVFGMYSWITVVLLQIMTAALMLTISLHSQSTSLHKFCSLVITLTDGYRQAPPTTPTGKTISVRMETLRRDLNCGSGK